ncbi:hypothetical protein MSAN_00270800 [Mycena sanguinolenta]|uniref:Uncharacterized protein n=1 Tax=Mycena sanguinolenta TaxID=230812 RepID=A0A8H6ZJH0_9AGAR|nr:hypothetical protein MSAN_00270800 [Mycena sanguinolenta]
MLSANTHCHRTLPILHILVRTMTSLSACSQATCASCTARHEYVSASPRMRLGRALPSGPYCLAYVTRRSMPATTPNTLVVFDEHSFFLGHGSRHAFQNVPEHFAAQVQGVDLPITQTGCISFDLTGGFYVFLDEETENEIEHPLTKVMLEFDEGWCIEPGSTLCPYSDRYLFLKFKQPNDNVIQMRWSLPDFMAQKLAELQQLTQSPEDQAFLNQLRMIETQQQQANIASAMQGLRFQAEMAMRGSRAANMLAEDYVEVRRYY